MNCMPRVSPGKALNHSMPLLRLQHIKPLKIENSGGKRVHLFDPPIAIAATLLLTIGLVTLVTQDLEQSPMSDPFDEPLMVESAPTSATPAPPMLSREQALPVEQEAFSDIVKSKPIKAVDHELQALEKAQIARLKQEVKHKRASEVRKQREQLAASALTTASNIEDQSISKDEVPIDKIVSLAMPAARSSASELAKSDPLADMAASPVTDTPDGASFMETPETSPKKALKQRVQRISPDKGQIRIAADQMEVWYNENERWVSPERYFELELKRLNGPTYGVIRKYPPYDSVKEWETLINELPDGRQCPMVFFHERWRRLPDVLALDEGLRNYGGCTDVFKH